ncbi:MAG: hypothetical protein AAF074_01180 [Pseudomonadota bacterium]
MKTMLVTAALGAALLASPAWGQGMLCGVRADIVAELEARFGETRRSYGFSRSQGVFEVFASEDGSWTIILTRPGGTACLMASGEAFEAEKPSAPESPA